VCSSRSEIRDVTTWAGAEVMAVMVGNNGIANSCVRTDQWPKSLLRTAR